MSDRQIDRLISAARALLAHRVIFRSLLFFAPRELHELSGALAEAVAAHDADERERQMWAERKGFSMGHMNYRDR